MKTFKLRRFNLRLLLHISAWIIILGLPFYNLYRVGFPKEFVWGYYIGVIINGIIFYGNYILLIPRLYFRNKRLEYYFAAFILGFFMFFVSMFSYHTVFTRVMEQRREPIDRIERNEPERRTGERRRPIRLPFGPMGVSHFTFNAIVFTVFAFGMRVIERHADIEKKQKELEREKLNSELAFLKNQISPHFFFNTLNNIYSLIGINKDDSQNAVLKLSKMMRYLLYESDQGETRLSNEIDFMNNYIDLMRLRISEKVKLNISFPLDNDNLAIPPLLFISVIENAFKHGVSYREKSFININMKISGNIVNFICENSLVSKPESETNGSSGIGLENLRKRLSILFPGKHELSIDKSAAVFRVAIVIELNKS